MIAHNELGHDPVDGKDYDGKPVRMCPLYPGMTCRDHTDAAVDIDTAKGEGLTRVPFIELCPNSWLVPPVGEPVRIPEAEQFVAGKVEASVKKLQKTLGPSLAKTVVGQVKNALGAADKAIDDEAWTKSLEALAGIAAHVKKPHKALEGLIGSRLEAVAEQVEWAFEDARDGDEPIAERMDVVAKLIKALDVSVYGKEPKPRAAMQAWLKKQATKTR